MNTTTPWFTPNALQKNQLTPIQKDWLLDDGSLTKRLILLSNNKFSVGVQSNGWGRPTRHEAAAPGIPTKQFVFIREVVLYCDAVPYVFARTLIPAHCLVGEMAVIRRFGNKSLGHFLFSSPKAQRREIQLCQLEGNDKVLPEHLHEANSIWGRRSVFDVAGKSLLVSELFLSPFKL